MRTTRGSLKRRRRTRWICCLRAALTWRSGSASTPTMRRWPAAPGSGSTLTPSTTPSGGETIGQRFIINLINLSIFYLKNYMPPPPSLVNGDFIFLLWVYFLYRILPQCGGAGAGEAEIILWSRSCNYQELFRLRIQKKIKILFYYSI